MLLEHCVYNPVSDIYSYYICNRILSEYSIMFFIITRKELYYYVKKERKIVHKVYDFTYMKIMHKKLQKLKTKKSYQE